MEAHILTKALLHPCLISQIGAHLTNCRFQLSFAKPSLEQKWFLEQIHLNFSLMQFQDCFTANNTNSVYVYAYNGTVAIYFKQRKKWLSKKTLLFGSQSQN